MEMVVFVVLRTIPRSPYAHQCGPSPWWAILLKMEWLPRRREFCKYLVVLVFSQWLNGEGGSQPYCTESSAVGVLSALRGSWWKLIAFPLPSVFTSLGSSGGTEQMPPSEQLKEERGSEARLYDACCLHWGPEVLGWCKFVLLIPGQYCCSGCLGKGTKQVALAKLVETFIWDIVP